MAIEERIQTRTIEEEMKTAYIDYSMSVIVSRALPDVRDGLKPVHRRVLYGMSELGLASNRPFKKSARIVGEVLGKYHPHGDSAVYETMVRLAQPWSLRYPLVDGQGNFGSIDGDGPAAMRYTEARLLAIAEEMLADIDKNTVDFVPNFDDSLKEPTVLPSKLPNLLVNGASGIAVGMATNIAPHNLREVVAGICAYIENRDISLEELMKHIKAPDFPTGGIIYGYEGVREAFATGKGKITLRALARIETLKNGKQRIIVTEIPYQVNKAALVEKIAALRDEKKIEGMGDIRDESDREGLRVVIELKKDAQANIVLNNLYKQTQLQVSFSINNVALVKGRPMQLSLRDMIHHFVNHRHEVVVRRTQYELDQALHRAHILEGLIIALDNLDAVIQLIRSSESPEVAKVGLMNNFGLTEIQAKAILDMRLQRLTSLEMNKIRLEYEELLKKIEHYRKILAEEPLRMQIIKEELQEIAQKYGDERRTQIVYSTEDFRIEDMIANEEVIITISHSGYIKRTPLKDYRSQGRGGIGARATETKEEDFVEHLFMASTHNYLLLFTQNGKCFWIKAFEVPEGNRNARGRAIQNLIQIGAEDRVKAYINVKTLDDEAYLKQYSIVMCTEKGVIKKTLLSEYARPRASGILAIHINDEDSLLGAALTTNQDEIIIATQQGYAIRFPADSIREMGRGAAGVKAIDLHPEDRVVGMVVIDNPQKQLLVLSEKGFGKRSRLEEYRVTNRGGKGVRTINITERTGALVGIAEVTDADDLMIITQEGIGLRLRVKDIPLAGRNTQGSRLIRLRDNDSIAALAKLAEKTEEDSSIATAKVLSLEDGMQSTLFDSTPENGQEIENNTDDE
ncbi:MAG: DNA gyrase subunit A [Bacteroidia bacterium]|nr:DNA gyrase subunit A [Bacteroidia bacterium]MDW8158719.1 DNA gyrase subunit A [Bacteroidia bacterium]